MPRKQAVASVRAQNRRDDPTEGLDQAISAVQLLPGAPTLSPEDIAKLMAEGGSLDPKEAWETEQVQAPAQAPATSLDSITITRDTSILRPEDLADGDLGLEGQPTGQPQPQDQA